MVRSVEYQDPGRLDLIKALKAKARENSSGLWESVASELSRVRKNRRQVNVHKISQYTAEGDIVVVPGKVLGDGVLDHKVDVAAFRFTTGALEKIQKAGGKAMTITQLLESNPKGSNIKLMG